MVTGLSFILVIVGLGVVLLIAGIVVIIWLQNRLANQDTGPRPAQLPSQEALPSWLQGITTDQTSPSQESIPPWLQGVTAGQASSSAALEAQIRALLQRGQAIEAIKVYRQATDVGLKEAKDAVENFEKGAPLAYVAAPAAAPLPADYQSQVIDLLRRGQKIEAIKAYRQATNVGLKEAKDAVEALERSRNY